MTETFDLHDPLNRRRILTGALAGVAVLTLGAARTRSAAAFGLRAPLRQILTAGFASATMDLVAVPETTTFVVTTTLEAPAEALRIGIGNPTPTPFQLGGACCAPEKGRQWTRLTFGGSNQPIIVPGNRVAATGAKNVPAILWSDWATIADQGAGRPVLQFRLLSGPQTAPMTLVGLARDVHHRNAQTEDRPFSSHSLQGDWVSDPRPSSIPGQPTNHAPIMVVQYRTAVGGVQILLGGDSQLASWAAFPQFAAAELSTPQRPISVWNVAWAAQPSGTFWQLFQDAIPQCQPSIAVLEGWTANDGMNSTAYARYLDRLRASVALVRRGGGVPIIIAPMPRALFGTPELAGWQAYGAGLARALPGVTLLDPLTYTGDPQHPGNWRPEFTSENGIHVNPDGNVALTPPFRGLLASLI